MTKADFKGFVNVLKSSIHKQHVILALVKDDRAIMCNDQYPTKHELMKDCAMWAKKGYKVIYVK